MSIQSPAFRDVAEFEALVHEAFATHADHGKGNAMTTAVLKNRLLQATKKQFRESDFGYSNLASLLAQIPDVVEVDTNQRPAMVRLREHEQLADGAGDAHGSTPDLNRHRVRQDLWDAVLDISDTQHAWDAAGDRVVDLELRPASQAGDVTAHLPLLPRLHRSDLDGARQTFAELHWTTEEGDRWRAAGGSVKALPPHLRGEWASELKRLVLRLIESWVEEHDLVEPPGLLTPNQQPRPLKRAQSSLDTGNELRDYLLAVISAMSDAELSMMQVPATAAARARRS